MAINFPNSPSDGQVYFDTTSGNRYVYDATAGTWMSRANGFYSTVETGQVIFDANDVTGGSNGLYFSTSANTLFANSINVATDMRVRGNLYIGTNTVTITDSAIMAQTFYVMQNGTPLAVPTGAAANASYEVANSAFAHTNTTLTHSQTVYGAVNSVFGVANAGFDLANTKVSKSGDTITGTLSIVGDLVVSGNTYQLNANTMSISDPLIYLAANNYVSDIVDIGFIANYVNTGGANVHTGLYREHTDKEYYLFQGYDREPINNHIGAMSNNMTLSVLNANIRTSNLNLGGANAITWISSGYGVANAAFGKANTALQNTSGTLAGSLTVSGSLNVATGNTYFVTGPNYYSSARIGQRPAGDGISSFEFEYSSSVSGSKFDIASGGLVVYPNTWTGLYTTTFDKSGNILNNVSVRSPIFYDSDNTSYYLNPAGTSAFGDAITINSTTDQQITMNATDSNWVYMGYSWNGTRKGYIGADSSGNHIWGLDTGSYYYTNGGYFTIAGSVRSPIFYDSNDTNYYTNPNDFSRMYGININYLRGSRQINSVYNSSNTLLATPTGIEFDSGSAFIHFTNGNAIAPFATYRSSGDLPAPYGIGWGNGGESSGIFQRLSSGGSFGEMIFYIGNDGAGSFAFRRGTWEGTAQQPSGSNQYDYLLATIDWSGNLIGTGSVRGPIFYDYNNTGYYTDPASTSNMSIVTATRLCAGYNSGDDNSVQCTNWFRSSGDSGWYSQTYGGGVYMTDGTWIRLYGGKQLYSTGYFQSDASMRSPIFYDSNDTGYYCDPNGTSYFNQLRAAGHVIQVQHAVAGPARQTITSTTPVAVTGLSISFTPKYSTSKIVVMCSLSITKGHVMSFGLFKDGAATVSTSGQSNSNEPNMQVTIYEGADNDQLMQIPMYHVETSGSTAARTYAVYATAGWGGGGYTLYMNNRGSNDMAAFSHMTIWEIAQ